MRSWSAQSNFICAAALVILASACSQPPLLTEKEVSTDILETHVWNNFMPGSTPRCHAVFSVRITNRSDETFVLRPGEMLITNAYNGEAMGRYVAVMLFEDSVRDTLHVPPGEQRDVTFRTPEEGVDTIDFSLYGEIRLKVHIPVGERRSIELISRPAVGFTTQ